MSSELSKLEIERPVEGNDEPDRRDALRKISKYAAYMAPALLVMLSSNQAASADSPKPPPV